MISITFLVLLLAALCSSSASASTFNLRRGVTQSITRGLVQDDPVPKKDGATDGDATTENATAASTDGNGTIAGNGTDLVDNIAESNVTIDDSNVTIDNSNLTIADNNTTIDEGNSTIEDSNATIEDSNSTSDGNETAGETAALGAVLYTIYPTKDTYMDEENPSSEFGNSKTIQVRNKDDEDLVSILEFNMTGVVVEGSYSAKLKLSIKNVKGEGARVILVKKLVPESEESEWSEDAEGKDLEDYLEDAFEDMDEVKSVKFTVVPNQGEAEVDITSLVNMEDESLTLVLEGDTDGSESRTTFWSGHRDNSDNKPTLVFESMSSVEKILADDGDNTTITNATDTVKESNNETVADNGDNTTTTNGTGVLTEADGDDETKNTTDVVIDAGEDFITTNGTANVAQTNAEDDKDSSMGETVKESTPAQDLTDAVKGGVSTVEILEKKAKVVAPQESP